jgi:hypothetical protein
MLTLEGLARARESYQDGRAIGFNDGAEDCQGLFRWLLASTG